MQNNLLIQANRYIPFGFVLMSVVFSIFGMADQNEPIPKIIALATLHCMFVLMLAGALELSMHEYALKHYVKMTCVILLAGAFGAFDVWLVHYGLELMLTDWSTVGVWAGSVAFAVINVFAHWGYTPSEEVEAKKPVAKVSNIEDVRQYIR